METRNAPRKSTARPIPAAAALMAALILGICLIISAVIVNGGLKKLTAAINEKDFAATLSSPSNLTVKPESTDYFTAAEAAQYLKITESEVRAAINNGEISEYISTSAGYSISKKALDEYFSNKAYAQMLNDNNSAGE